MHKVLIKLGLIAASDERGQKVLLWISVAIFAPLILLVAVISSLAAGSAEHNNETVQACFYGTAYSEKVPLEFRGHISEIQSAVSVLDSAVTAVNTHPDADAGLDPTMVKAVFFALCFGEDSPSNRAARRFVECFYTTEERTRIVEIEPEEGSEETEPESVEETYMAIVPLSLESAYANLASELDREITEDDRDNISHIYTMIAGPMGVTDYSGEYVAGGARSTEIDISIFSDPMTKNAKDLAAYAINAWQSGWGYVWGTYGQILSSGQLQSKLEQYPKSVGPAIDFIRSNWVGGRTADCVGLIKGYSWLNPEDMSINYGTNGMPDVGANHMYYNASVSGTIDTIPEIPGLAVWHDGHIGVYIGNGEVIEAMGTMYGVVKTSLQGRGWTHWLQIPYISYN